MAAVLLALAASASWGVSDFLGGVKSRAAPVLTVLSVSQPAGLVLLGAIEAGTTEARRAEAWTCLKQRGYAVDYQPDARAESIRKK